MAPIPDPDAIPPRGAGERADGPGAAPRAIGRASVGVALDASGRPRLTALRQSGALKLMFPRRRADRTEVVAVNTAGGITGGDDFALAAEARAGAHLSLTTQAAERAYAAQPGAPGRLRTRLVAGAGARLDWLPQETILFDRCNLARRLEVELAGDAQFLMVEPVILGRRARGERLRDARFIDRIAIRRDGAPLYLDGCDLAGDIEARFGRAAIGGGAGAMATLLHVAPGAEDHLPAIRAGLPRSAGASALARDMIVLRALAADGFALRGILLPVLDRLTRHALPAVWRL